MHRRTICTTCGAQITQHRAPHFSFGMSHFVGACTKCGSVNITRVPEQFQPRPVGSNPCGEIPLPPEGPCRITPPSKPEPRTWIYVRPGD